MLLRVPKRGWMPPVTNSSPSWAERRSVVPASPPGPAAKTMWSRRMVDSDPARFAPRHRGVPISTWWKAGRSGGSWWRRVQGQRGAGPQVGLAGPGEHVVRRLAHQREQLGRVADEDRLGAHVGLGVARAV